jgi:RNA polymerase sigma factor (sigma-70 family)
MNSMNTISLEDLDIKLDAWADEPLKFEGRIRRLASKWNREGTSFELKDPDSWRVPRRPVNGVATIEDQLRAEIDSIIIMGRDEEARHARRIEFARACLELSLKEHGLQMSDLEGRVHYHPQTFRDLEPTECELPRDVFNRWKELHGLRTELVERNLYLALINVERYAHFGVPRLDLVQDGSAALFRAADGFDWRRGLLFRTYAVHWLNQAFRSHLYNHGQTVRIPVYLQKAMRHVKAAMGKLGSTSSSAAAIADLTGMRLGLVESALTASRSTLSIDASSGDDGEGPGLADSLSDERSGGLYQPSMEDVTLREGLGEALDLLSERERLVLERRYGLGASDEHTLSELAGELGVSLERVRQIQMRALGKLRTPALRKTVDPFI